MACRLPPPPTPHSASSIRGHGATGVFRPTRNDSSGRVRMSIKLGHYPAPQSVDNRARCRGTACRPLPLCRAEGGRASPTPAPAGCTWLQAGRILRGGVIWSGADFGIPVIPAQAGIQSGDCPFPICRPKPGGRPHLLLQRSEEAESAFPDLGNHQVSSQLFGL